MKVEILPSAVGQQSPQQFCIGALVNDTISIDAGSIGLLWPLERQKQIEHVFLTHSHVDHIATLPIFLDNVYEPGPNRPSVYACEATEQCLRTNVFNDVLWPDFVRLSAEESPFLNLQTLRSEEVVDLGSVRVTPVAVNHVVPTMAFVLEDADNSVAFVTDTHETDQIWQVLQQTPNLRAVFLECCFPNSHRELAQKSGHLCPELFERYASQLPNDVQVLATHLKPCFFDQIKSELQQIDRPGITIAVPGEIYEW